MVTRDDIHLEMFPPESCCNCGFVGKWSGDSTDGQNGSHGQPLTLYERWAGLDEHNDAVWSGRRIAVLECWMRRGFLEQEAPVTGSSNRAAVAVVLDTLHKDRSEASGADHCTQYTPWVPHLNYVQHWEERKTYLLERDSKKFLGEMNQRADNTQRFIAAMAAATIVASVLIAVIGNQCTTRTEVRGVVPVTVVTPAIQAAPTQAPPLVPSK